MLRRPRGPRASKEACLDRLYKLAPGTVHNFWQPLPAAQRPGASTARGQGGVQANFLAVGDNVSAFIVTCDIVTAAPTPVSSSVPPSASVTAGARATDGLNPSGASAPPVLPPERHGGAGPEGLLSLFRWRCKNNSEFCLFLKIRSGAL